MRIGILSDIHGNLPALQAVLSGLRGDAVDLYLCLGDVALVGPQPSECLDVLRQLSPGVFILGNTDVYIYEPPAPKEIVTRRDRWVMELIHWTQERLRAEQIEWIRGFVRTHTVDLGGGPALLAYHASPGNLEGVIKADTPEEDLARLFDGWDAPLCIGGHTHLPLLRRWEGRTLLNPGSTGATFRKDEKHIRPPWAEYAVLDATGGRLDISFRRAPLDLEAVRRAAAQSGMPGGEDWAAAWGE